MSRLFKDFSYFVEIHNEVTAIYELLCELLKFKKSVDKSEKQSYNGIRKQQRGCGQVKCLQPSFFMFIIILIMHNGVHECSGPPVHSCTLFC